MLELIIKLNTIQTLQCENCADYRTMDRPKTVPLQNAQSSLNSYSWLSFCFDMTVQLLSLEIQDNLLVYFERCTYSMTLQNVSSICDNLSISWRSLMLWNKSELIRARDKHFEQIYLGILFRISFRQIQWVNKIGISNFFKTLYSTSG